uniref:AlNc14C63G4529 protein n=1 Tax=Albugo laibachii Nc14 TaxID=890382 RepID=F0WD05_9STRA|nr:AlNc14C63G4529 [Albugo laibachii Nc14]|eukprot:CCA19077.1 AlNc14C63G4529 [Albugo laibachii Nc14]
MCYTLLLEGDVVVHVTLDVLGHVEWSATMTSLNDRAVVSHINTKTQKPVILISSAVLHTSLRNMPPPECTVAHFDCLTASCLTASTTFSPVAHLSSFKVYSSMSKAVLIVTFSRINGRSDSSKLQFQVCCCKLLVQTRVGWVLCSVDRRAKMLPIK